MTDTMTVYVAAVITVINFLLVLITVINIRAAKRIARARLSRSEVKITK